MSRAKKELELKKQSTRELVKAALALVQRERYREDEIINLPLICLHERANQEVVQTGLALLVSSYPAERELGARILRELPSLDKAPHEYSQQILQAMRPVIAEEKDESALCAELSAVGWQCLPEGTEILLSKRKDDRELVRYKVAMNLLLACPEGAPLPEPVAQGFLALICDPDEDIRWSVLWDISEWPEFFLSRKHLFQPFVDQAMNDADPSVQKQAARANDALAGRTPEEM